MKWFFQKMLQPKIPSLEIAFCKFSINWSTQNDYGFCFLAIPTCVTVSSWDRVNEHHIPYNQKQLSLNKVCCIMLGEIGIRVSSKLAMSCGQRLGFSKVCHYFSLWFFNAIYMHLHHHQRLWHTSTSSPCRHLSHFTWQHHLNLQLHLTFLGFTSYLIVYPQLKHRVLQCPFIEPLVLPLCGTLQTRPNVPWRP